MEHSKYRLVMGIISILFSILAFGVALTSCVLYCIFNEEYLKLLFLPLLLGSCLLSAAATLFSVLNSGSKLGLASLAFSLAGIVCLIVALTQL